MAEDTPDVSAYYAYHYTFLDDLAFVRDAHEIATLWERLSPISRLKDPDRWIEVVRERLLKEGWEGDGRIGLIWIPPFADVGAEDTHGTYIWHVKQLNNGVSWLLSPVPLEFARLRQQNPWEATPEARGWVPVSIVDFEVNSFLEEIDGERGQLADRSRAVRKHLPPEVTNEVLSDLLAFHQGMLISRLNSFMESCYVQLLQEVIIRGNPYGLKLRKASVRLNPSAYAPPDLNPGEETPEFLTLAGIVSDAWRDYRFEDFATKSDMLFRGVNFSPEPTVFAEIKKHVEIRNCIQHGRSRLSPDSLRRLGVHEILVRAADPPAILKISAWQPITLSLHELDALCDALTALGNDFKTHVDQTVPSRAYVRPPLQPPDTSHAA